MTGGRTGGTGSSSQRGPLDGAISIQVAIEGGCPSCGGQPVALKLSPVRELDEEFVVAELVCSSCGAKYLLSAKFIKV